MAQDLFLIPLATDLPEGFDRKLVIDILSKGATEPVRCFECRYLDGSRGEAHAVDHDDAQVRLGHLGFTHFGGRMMMERIFELADTLEVFLAWSDALEGEPSACVTRTERLDRVPEEAKPHLDFVVARDASHLNLLVKGVTFEENGW